MCVIEIKSLLWTHDSIESDIDYNMKKSKN